MSASMPMPSPDDTQPPGNTDSHIDIQRAHALLDQLRAAGHRSTADILHELRRAFPDAPLAMRVRALEALRRP